MKRQSRNLTWGQGPHDGLVAMPGIIGGAKLECRNIAMLSELTRRPMKQILAAAVPGNAVRFRIAGLACRVGTQALGDSVINDCAKPLLKWCILTGADGGQVAITTLRTRPFIAGRHYRINCHLSHAIQWWNRNWKPRAPLATWPMRRITIPSQIRNDAIEESFETLLGTP